MNTLFNLKPKFGGNVCVSDCLMIVWVWVFAFAPAMISGVHLYMESERLTVYVLFTDVEHCASNDFRCLYMDGCVPPSKVCDGKYDCLDASDEMGCDISTPKTPGTTTAGDNPCSKRTFNHKLHNISCNWILFLAHPCGIIWTARIWSQIELNIIVIVINLEITKHKKLWISFQN